MFKFSDSRPVTDSNPVKTNLKSEFSLNDAKKQFAENSQQIRKQFANLKPATTRVFAEFAEFATFSKSEKQPLLDNQLNHYEIQELNPKFSGLNIRDFYIDDDRRFCFECKNLLKDRRCFIAVQGKMERATRYYKPVDICPRRCIHFMEAGQ